MRLSPRVKKIASIHREAGIMLAWFIQWTTQLNQADHVAFAAVTVLTMAAIGGGLALVAEVLLMRLAAGRSGAPEHHGPSGR